VNTTLTPLPGSQLPPNRPVWLAIIVLAAVMTAAAAAIALCLSRAAPAVVVGGAGGAFATAMSLGIAVSRFLSG
jgi:hypothetical protein